LYRARKELDRLDSAVKCINISDVNNESKIFEILGIQLSADIIFTAYSLYRGTVRRQKRDSVVFKYIILRKSLRLYGYAIIQYINLYYALPAFI
jgi:hypothetical protein